MLTEDRGFTDDAIAFPPLVVVETDPLLRDSGLTLRDVTAAIYEVWPKLKDESREIRWTAVRLALQRKVMRHA